MTRRGEFAQPAQTSQDHTVRCSNSYFDFQTHANAQTLAPTNRADQYDNSRAEQYWENPHLGRVPSETDGAAGLPFSQVRSMEIVALWKNVMSFGAGKDVTAVAVRISSHQGVGVSYLGEIQAAMRCGWDQNPSQRVPPLT